METTNGFLRRLSRFNVEVRLSLERDEARPTMAAERLTACEDAEQELRTAVSRREAAERNLQLAEQLRETAHDNWRQAELDERIARADAEAQVWTLMATSTEGRRLQAVWQSGTETKAPTWQADKNPPVYGNRFFAVARVRDDSYRFFTLAPAH